MDITTLLLLYLISQNPDFTKKLQPVMQNLKNSEEMLRFMKDLSSFSDLFAQKQEEKKQEKKEPEKEKPRSPTKGIADDFIEKTLNDYFNK